MEQTMLWVTVVGIIILPIVGYVFNSLITRKIDDNKDKLKELEVARNDDKKLLFDRLDAVKNVIEDKYVKKEIYDQAMTFHQKETDSKFNNLVETMNKQFVNVEDKIDALKDLINEKVGKKGD